jgi:hypothetical protein
MSPGAPGSVTARVSPEYGPDASEPTPRTRYHAIAFDGRPASV